jgi:hypothetical protein
MTFLSLRPATTCFVHFPPGVKVGQRRPARYTRLKMTKVGNRLRLRQSTTPEMSTGLMGPAALIGA